MIYYNGDPVLLSKNATVEGGVAVDIVQETGTRTDAVMSQKAVTVELEEKLDKLPSNNSNQIYGVNPQGDQTSFLASATGLYKYSIPMRGEDFNFKVKDSTDTQSCATRGYVDKRYRHILLFECLDANGSMVFEAVGSLYTTSSIPLTEQTIGDAVGANANFGGVGAMPCVGEYTLYNLKYPVGAISFNLAKGYCELHYGTMTAEVSVDGMRIYDIVSQVV